MISVNNFGVKKIYFGILIFFMVVVYLFITQKIGKDREEQFFIRFDNSNISGNIEYAKIGYHGSVFKIEGIEKEFVFYPFTSELNNNQIFYKIAKRGDLIIKEVNSDTLKLKKNGKVYFYKFRKPND